MANDQTPGNDPLGFVRNMWGNMGFSLPGMAVPTFDTEELEKRIKDLKAVEGWLRMNLSMLQMTIQSLEMQSSTLSAVKAMGSMAASAAQQAAEHMSSRETPPPAAAPSPKADLEQAAEAGAQAADALSQAAMWPWNLMQQMQEHLQHQAAEQEAKPARKPAARKTTAKAADNPKRPDKS